MNSWRSQELEVDPVGRVTLEHEALDGSCSGWLAVTPEKGFILIYVFLCILVGWLKVDKENNKKNQNWMFANHLQVNFHFFQNLGHCLLYYEVTSSLPDRVVVTGCGSHLQTDQVLGWNPARRQAIMTEVRGWRDEKICDGIVEMEWMKGWKVKVLRRTLDRKKQVNRWCYSGWRDEDDEDEGMKDRRR